VLEYIAINTCKALRSLSLSVCVSTTTVLDDCLSAFAIETFLPYLAPAVSGLVSLAKALQDNMVTIYILDVVVVICNRVRVACASTWCCMAWN
jgi:hypothetical protein